jgi:hypothetical protein
LDGRSKVLTWQDGIHHHTQSIWAHMPAVSTDSPEEHILVRCCRQNLTSDSNVGGKDLADTHLLPSCKNKQLRDQGLPLRPVQLLNAENDLARPATSKHTSGALISSAWFVLCRVACDALAKLDISWVEPQSPRAHTRCGFQENL